MMASGMSPVDAKVAKGWIPAWARRRGNEQLWTEVRRKIESSKEQGVNELLSKSGNVKVKGNDMIGKNLAMTRDSLELLGLPRNCVELECDKVDRLAFRRGGREGEGWVNLALTNPPWGRKVRYDEEGLQLTDAWRGLGEWSKRQCSGGELWVLSPKTELSGELRMRRSRGMSYQQGEDRLRLSQYKIK